jgi:DNA modification methylase
LNVIANIEGLTVGQIAPDSIVNADCLEAMKLIPDNSIDLILTDPPYFTAGI